MLPMSVVRSSSDKLTIDRIAYRREGGDGSAQRGRSVIYDCLVLNIRPLLLSAVNEVRRLMSSIMVDSCTDDNAVMATYSSGLLCRTNYTVG